MPPFDTAPWGPGLLRVPPLGLALVLWPLDRPGTNKTRSHKPRASPTTGHAQRQPSSTGTPWQESGQTEAPGSRIEWRQVPGAPVLLPAESGAHGPPSAQREPTPPGHANTGPARDGNPPHQPGASPRGPEGEESPEHEGTTEKKHNDWLPSHTRHAGGPEPGPADGHEHAHAHSGTMLASSHPTSRWPRRGGGGRHTRHTVGHPPAAQLSVALRRGGRGPVDHQPAPRPAHQGVAAWPRLSRGNPGWGRGR